MRTEIEHHYGPQVHILNNNHLFGLLAKLCLTETQQPQINHLVEILFTHLLTIVTNQEFPSEKFQVDTRMSDFHPEVKLSGERLKQDQRVICVNLARAGTYPSHVCYDKLNYVINPSCLRQDHIFAARTVSDKGNVTGVEFSSAKIGGDKESAIVLFPDPMGATGNTILTALDYYIKKVPGKAFKTIALHLIVTPEYLKMVTKMHPELVIYSIRVDRGLSSPEILKTQPGKHWDLEKGLNEKDYIIPGGGGFGEIMNNSFV